MPASFLLNPIIGGAVVVIIFAGGRKSNVTHPALFTAASVRPPLIGNHSRSLFGPSCQRMAVVLQAAGGVFDRNAGRGCYYQSCLAPWSAIVLFQSDSVTGFGAGH